MGSPHQEKIQHSPLGVLTLQRPLDPLGPWALIGVNAHGPHPQGVTDMSRIPQGGQGFTAKVVSAKTKFSSVLPGKKMVVFTPPCPSCPPCRLHVTSLEFSFLKGEKITFSLFLVQGGQGGQGGPREGPGRSLRNHKVHFFREVNILFADEPPHGE
jgi:hypothetical protein